MLYALKNYCGKLWGQKYCFCFLSGSNHIRYFKIRHHVYYQIVNFSHFSHYGPEINKLIIMLPKGRSLDQASILSLEY